MGRGVVERHICDGLAFCFQAKPDPKWRYRQAECPRWLPSPRGVQVDHQQVDRVLRPMEVPSVSPRF